MRGSFLQPFKNGAIAFESGTLHRHDVDDSVQLYNISRSYFKSISMCFVFVYFSPSSVNQSKV